MSDTIDTIVMDHTRPVVGGTPVLHTEPKQPQEQPKPEAQPAPAQPQEVQVTTTVKPAEPAEQPNKD